MSYASRKPVSLRGKTMFSPQKCDHCGRTFAAPFYLDKHQTEQHGAPKKKKVETVLKDADTIAYERELRQRGLLS